MERDQEIRKLISVVGRVARAAEYLLWSGSSDAEAARYLAAQYNRLLARLGEIEPATAQTFAPLAEGATPEVIRIAARELAAYFEDETGRSEWRGRGWQGRRWRGRAGIFVWPRAHGRC